jgi:hypothetical protein
MGEIVVVGFTQTNRQQYRWAICAGRAGATGVPFKKVNLASGVPEIAKCHENVDRYVLENSGFSVVRGWLTVPWLGSAAWTAHSVVMSPEGVLFDITPFAHELDRSALRFVLHDGDEDAFRREREFQPLFYCDCPTHPQTTFEELMELAGGCAPSDADIDDEAPFHDEAPFL